MLSSSKRYRSPSPTNSVCPGTHFSLTPRSLFALYIETCLPACFVEMKHYTVTCRRGKEEWFLEASAPGVVGSPDTCLIERRILLFWLSQCGNFCKTLPMYLQLWQCHCGTGVVRALSDLNSWAVLVLLGLSPSARKLCLP